MNHLGFKGIRVQNEEIGNPLKFSPLVFFYSPQTCAAVANISLIKFKEILFSPLRGLVVDIRLFLMIMPPTQYYCSL
jgi:hypothetical protein